ncbi:MAG TPA: hypothetical protein PKG56_07080 [Chitinophagaceae bacterium]|nr:hypothetical protein [Chitinophagaceae bacterium]MCC6634671.1 hypothetical protein [Chitinophagaceae bacterium]HMZ45193.1 hypothetical protein [Chitinophagaceae bacterium]HNE94156.1 hypothetical protein [Chitinophagaceae bacterium]HNF29124.1 hypothetical protein [Chitinophagaceae bacterium]
MKTQQTNLLQPLTNNEIVKLTTTQNEIVAVADNNNNKVFSSADLWNLRRSRKSVTPIRRAAFIW